jgi:hypothetical protein
MVVVIAMLVVVMILVVIAVVFAIPVPFMNLPTFVVVIVVGVGPVGAGVGWALPSAGDPDIVAAARTPVPVDPGEAFLRHGRLDFIADWRRRGTDIDLDLAECRNCRSRCGDESA